MYDLGVFPFRIELVGAWVDHPFISRILPGSVVTVNVVNDFGRIDAVFANAGMNLYGGSFEDMDTDVYRKVLAVNLDGVFFTLREVCKHMVERAKKGDYCSPCLSKVSPRGVSVQKKRGYV